MMLRASSAANDLELDLDVVRGDPQNSDAIQCAPQLTALVDASVNDLESLPEARAALVEATDEATMLDAAAVVANFEMMTRIADRIFTSYRGMTTPPLSPVNLEMTTASFRGRI